QVGVDHGLIAGEEVEADAGHGRIRRVALDPGDGARRELVTCARGEAVLGAALNAVEEVLLVLGEGLHGWTRRRNVRLPGGRRRSRGWFDARDRRRAGLRRRGG